MPGERFLSRGGYQPSGIAAYTSGAGSAPDSGGLGLTPERARQYMLRPDQLRADAERDPSLRQYILRPDKLRAIPTPPGQQPQTSDITKTDLGPLSMQPQPAPDFSELQPPDQGPQPPIPYRMPGQTSNFDTGDTNHIRFALGSGPMEDYDPSRGIADYAGGEDDYPAASGFMGKPGIPGGGGFTGNALPVTGKTAMGRPKFDWSGVANPAAFEAYSDPLRDASLAGATKHAEAIAEDPYADQRAEADIWKQTQLDLQKGIRQQIIEEFRAAASNIEQSVRQDPQWQAKGEAAILQEIERRMNTLTRDYESAFGRGGPAGALPNTYPNYPDQQ